MTLNGVGPVRAFCCWVHAGSLDGTTSLRSRLRAAAHRRRRSAAVDLQIEAALGPRQLAQQRQRHRAPSVHAGVPAVVGDASQRDRQRLHTDWPRVYHPGLPSKVRSQAHVQQTLWRAIAPQASTLRVGLTIIRRTGPLPLTCPTRRSLEDEAL